MAAGSRVTCEAFPSHIDPRSDNLSGVPTTGVAKICVQHDHAADQSEIEVTEDDSKFQRKKRKGKERRRTQRVLRTRMRAIEREAREHGEFRQVGIGDPRAASVSQSTDIARHNLEVDQDQTPSGIDTHFHQDCNGDPGAIDSSQPSDQDQHDLEVEQTLAQSYRVSDPRISCTTQPRESTQHHLEVDRMSTHSSVDDIGSAHAGAGSPCKSDSSVESEELQARMWRLLDNDNDRSSSSSGSSRAPLVSPRLPAVSPFLPAPWCNVSVKNTFFSFSCDTEGCAPSQTGSSRALSSPP